jgi:PAS domain S-box-containing protein
MVNSKRHTLTTTTAKPRGSGIGEREEGNSAGSLAADIIIANAPDPVFVSDLQGKILQANEAVSELLGFRTDEVVEQSLSRFISPEETRQFTAALREVVERGVTRNARLNPRSASGEVIPTTLNASALRDADGKVIGAIGILRDMRAYEKVVRDLQESKAELQEKILDLEKFEEVVVGRELKMIALEKELEKLRRERESGEEREVTG